MQRFSSSFFGRTLGSIFVTAFSKIVAFIRAAVCAALFGATGQTDAFYISINIITMAEGPLSSLATVVVPTRTKALSDGRDSADNFTSALINLSMLAALGEGMLLFFMAPVLVRLFAPSFDGELYHLTVQIVRVFSPLIALLALASIFCGILNTHQRFIAANLPGLALNIGWVAIPLLLANRLGILAMVFGYITGAILQIVILFPSLSKVYRYHLIVNYKNKKVQQSLLMCLPIFVGIFAQQINQAIDKILASGLHEGNVSALGYSTQLIILIHGIVGIPVSTAIFTLYTRYAQENNMRSFKDLTRRSFWFLTIIMLPITAVCMIFSYDIVYVVYQRGAFDNAANLLTNSAFMYYSIGLLPTTLNLITIKCFYALYDMKTPLYIGLAGAALNVALSIILVQFMGIGGLALGASISYFAVFAAYLIFLRRKIGSLGILPPLKEALKVSVAFAVCLCVAGIVNSFLTVNPFVRLIISAPTIIAIYFILLLIMRQRDVQALFNNIMKRQ